MQQGTWVRNRSMTEEEEPSPGQPVAGRPLPKGEARNFPSPERGGQEIALAHCKSPVLTGCKRSFDDNKYTIFRGNDPDGETPARAFERSSTYQNRIYSPRVKATTTAPQSLALDELTSSIFS